MPGKPNVVFVLGGPGAGKGTECGKLVEEFGFVHLSAGDLLREERKNGGQQGELINDYIKEGKIIPVAITIGLIKTAMEKAGTEGKDKFLIDGFPRNADNLSGWNEIMDEVCEVHFCLYMECTEEIMQQRILGRNEGRADDNAEAIKKRFKTYVESTMPIIKIFEQRGLLRTVDSTGTPEEVHAVCQQLFAQFQPGSQDAAVVVVVSVEIKNDRVSDFLKAMKIDAEGSRKEEGCLRFDLLKNTSAGNKFTFYEAFKSPEAAAFHKTTDHYKAWADFKASGGVLSQNVEKHSGLDFQ